MYFLFLRSTANSLFSSCSFYYSIITLLFYSRIIQFHVCAYLDRNAALSPKTFSLIHSFISATLIDALYTFKAVTLTASDCKNQAFPPSRQPYLLLFLKSFWGVLLTPQASFPECLAGRYIFIKHSRPSYVLVLPGVFMRQKIASSLILENGENKQI